jgi:hypothetical protein
MQNKTNRLEKKRIQEELNKAMSRFMKHEVEEAIAVINQLESIQVPVSEQGKVQKVVMLLLAGTLYDMNTLSEILSLLGIKSNNYSKIWQKLSHKQVYDLFVMGSRQLFSKEYTKLLAQSESSQSRAEITIVGDDSIFKQWLKNVENDPFYGKFFSGQFQKTVYGYCVSLVGVVLHGTFYPLSFSLVPKVQAKAAENEVKVLERKKSLVQLEKGIKEVQNFLVELSKARKKELPTLYLSIDSGFNDKGLLDFCENLEIIAISVAKGNEIIFYKDKKMNFNELVDTIFLTAEKAFYKDKTNENKPFSLRLRVYYQKLKQSVTILIFRFNGSKKLTVIFAYDKNIFAKTLRRHFFQRTQIEQFFRMVKHTLGISQSKSIDYKSFIKKVAIFFLKAIFAFAFRDYCRKHFRRFKKFSFYKLRINILHHNADKSMLLNWL